MHEPSGVPGLPKVQSDGGGGEKQTPLAAQSEAAAVEQGEQGEVTLWMTVSAGFHSASFVLLVVGFFACGAAATHLAVHCTAIGLRPCLFLPF